MNLLLYHSLLFKHSKLGGQKCAKVLLVRLLLH